jgi:hypothetical protein
MGLTLYCEDEKCYFGYSGVHIIRIEILKATLKYLEEQEEEVLQTYRDDFLDDYDDQECWETVRKPSVMEDLNEAKDYLSSIIHNRNPLMTVYMTSSSNMPDYTKINNNKNEILKEFDVYGIIPIIQHSDCHGFYTVGEAIDFMKVLEKTYMYYDKSQFYFDMPVKLENHYMYPIFKKCIDTGKCIWFK